MIIYKTGDIFEEEVEAYVNPVNCEGTMDSGVARLSKQIFPSNFRAYQKACERGELLPGKLLVFELEQGPLIINLPTQKSVLEQSQPEYIKSGLQALVRLVRERSITTMAIPALGCGFGGLHWAEVKTWIEKGLASLGEVKILVYEPQAASVKKNWPALSENGRLKFNFEMPHQSFVGSY